MKSLLRIIWMMIIFASRCFHAPRCSGRPASPARPARSSCSSRTCATRRTASTSSGRRVARHPAGRATRYAGRSERCSPHPTSLRQTNPRVLDAPETLPRRGKPEAERWFPSNRRDADVWDGETDGEEEHVLTGRVYSLSRTGEFT